MVEDAVADDEDEEIDDAESETQTAAEPNQDAEMEDGKLLLHLKLTKL